MDYPLSKKQLEFIEKSTKKWNLAHGSVRSGKTVCTLFRFMEACYNCPDSQIWMIGRSSETIYDNAIRLILEKPSFASDPLGAFRPFCQWSKGKRELYFAGKTISTLGASNEGAIGQIQGKTFSLVYCDEMTLYPENIIDMIDTRLSNPHSMGFASMNPSHPGHRLKQWIDKAKDDESNYYALHFSLDDNPYLDQTYKDRIAHSLTGLFYKRNYLGLWCLAEGAIFDFFDRDIYVLNRPPRAAEYYIAGVDYGTANAFACVVVGISTGRYDRTGVCRWVEDEYYFDSKKQGKQKTNSEYAEDVISFLEPYGVRAIYIDPSATSFKLELQRRKQTVVSANNDVLPGIEFMSSEMKKGNLFILSNCKNLIREIEGCVWDSSKVIKGIDAPIKENDHCFEGNTLVLTDKGNIPIKDIKVGDLVFTRNGFRRVLRTGSNIKKVKTYDLFGKTITCTPDHKFYTSKGWKEIDSLIHSDILYMINDLWENQKKLNLMVEPTDAIQSLNELLNADILALMENISIELYGSSTMEKYQKDTIYITKTETPLTMILTIWNVFLAKNILQSTQILSKLIESLKKHEMLQPNGTSQMKAELGIDNTLLINALDNLTMEALTVKCAKSFLKKENWITDFAQTIVKVEIGGNYTLTMSLDTARSAVQLLQPLNMASDFSALTLAHGKNEKDCVVYNLEVDKDHEFFANGILVKNSVDATRYCIFSHKVSTYDADSARIKKEMEWKANAGWQTY